MMITQIELWAVSKLVPHARALRKNDHAVDRMVALIREFGLKLPLLIRGDGELVDGHLRLKAAKKLKLTEVPVLRCDEWTESQVKAFRLAVIVPLPGPSGTGTWSRKRSQSSSI